MKILILIILFFITACTNNEIEIDNSNIHENEIEEVTKNNFVSYNGNLKLDGTNLVNQYGEKIQLKGLSSHGIQWYGKFINEENIKVLKNYNSNVFRLAMYTKEGGYIDNSSILTELETYIDMLIKNDMYIIIDWHILSDNNPNTYKNQSKEFFSYISNKYKDVPNIIYEICNEPNGNVNWNNDIKPYALEIISEIRKNSKNSIIIVGTATWSQDILDPINNKIDDPLVMYSVHFYSGTHKEWLRDRVKIAIESGLPVFISEWGTSDASGNGGFYLDESKKWINFMDEYNISWINWSLSDKNESSAFLKPGATVSGFSDSDLSESGKFIKYVLN